MSGSIDMTFSISTIFFSDGKVFCKVALYYRIGFGEVVRHLYVLINFSEELYILKLL